jgi:hypothetical protein
MASTPGNAIALGGAVRLGMYLTAVLDGLLGFAFLLAEELHLPVWPTPLPPILMRFVGAIVLANGVALVVAGRQGTWEGARVLFTVGLTYGVVVLVALLYHLLLAGAPALFWGYTIADAVFVVVLARIAWLYEGRYRALL